MPEDSPVLASLTDAALANGSLILGVRATTVLSNVCQRLWERHVEIVSLKQQRDALQQKAFALRNDNRELRKTLKRVRKLRDAMANRLIFYSDFVTTRMAEFEDEMDEVQERGNKIQRSLHQNSHIPLPSGQKKSKSV